MYVNVLQSGTGYHGLSVFAVFMSAVLLLRAVVYLQKNDRFKQPNYNTTQIQGQMPLIN